MDIFLAGCLPSPEIKSQETIRTCLIQTGAKVSCDLARLFFYASRITWRGGLPRGGPTPSWKHRETTQELCEFIRLRQTCGVGTIVEPLWSHAGTLCCHMVSSCLRRRNHRGTTQEPGEFIRLRHTCGVGTIVEPCRSHVFSYGFVLLATSEPSWNQAGTL